MLLSWADLPLIIKKTMEAIHQMRVHDIYLGQVSVSRSLDQGHMRLILCILLQVYNKIKVIHQGEGHIKVKVKISSSFQFSVCLSCIYFKSLK